MSLEGGQKSNWWFAVACWAAAFAALLYTANTGNEVYGILFIVTLFGFLATLGIRYPRS